MSYSRNISENSALVLIDVQKGFLDPSYWGRRNNPSFEENISKLLSTFRMQERPIIHIQHLSNEAQSPLRPNFEGSEFMDFAVPVGSEKIFKKSVNSAFIGTGLESYLRNEEIENLFIAGLTTDHCVSTSVRMAANLGFSVTVVHDATATFGKSGTNGKQYDAELVHQVSLASLHKEFATVTSTCESIRKICSLT